MLEKYEIKDLIKNTKDKLQEALEEAYDTGYVDGKEENEK